MLKLQIEKPIWNTESVGIAARRLVDGTSMDVTIAYEDSHKQLVYPYVYRMACSKMRKYPTQMIKGTLLHIIPIEDFEVIYDT